MRQIIVTDPKLIEDLDAEALATADLGPPVNVGNGRHAPPEASIATRYAPAFKHPKRNEWRYLVDEHAEQVAAKMRAEAKPIPEPIEKLPDEWISEERAEAERKIIFLGPK